jgi:hypothetical protein
MLQVKRHGTQFIYFLPRHFPDVVHHDDEEHHENDQPERGVQAGVINLFCVLPDEFEHDLFLSGL